jgi:hypothetical protein
MNKVSILTLLSLLLGTVTSELAIATDYSGSNCTGAIKSYRVWDTSCMSDGSAGIYF